MIDESYLQDQSNRFNQISDRFNNIGTMLSGAPSSMNFSSYVPSADDIGNDAQNQLNSALNSANSALDGALGKLANAAGSMQSVKTPTGGKKINGNGPSGGIIAKLIALIMGIIELPMRFTYMSIGLAEGSIALALSMEGLGQSIALAGEDFWYLIVAIAIVIWKYTLCVISFIISTVAGCFMVHVITFAISVLFLIFPISAFVFEIVSGIDISPQIELAFEKMHEVDHQMAAYTGMYLMQWPDTINTFCYTCFGTPVKMKDVITDVWAIKSAGDMISYDFSVRMPQYMKEAAPFAKAADDAMNKVMS